MEVACYKTVTHSRLVQTTHLVITHKANFNFTNFAPLGLEVMLQGFLLSVLDVSEDQPLASSDLQHVDR